MAPPAVRDRGRAVLKATRAGNKIVRERADGSEELVTIIGSGGYFGELAPIFGLRRSATARARRSAKVTGYTVRAFRELRPIGTSELIAGGA